MVGSYEADADDDGGAARLYKGFAHPNGEGPSTSHAIGIRDATVSDDFWKGEQELVRSAVLPYQWRVLNDKVPGADPSYCMHNFRAAARQNARRSTSASEGASFEPPTYTDRGFDVLPDDPNHPDPDRFYGFVFQDTDFSKWIEAVGYSLAHHPDPKLEATADGAIDIVCAAQQENGYLDTYYILNGMDRHFTNLKDHHELYCMGHLIEGAVAYFEGTGKTKLLHAAERFADYVASVFGKEPGKRHGYPGHEIAEMALIRLYSATGKRRYLDLAAYFVNQRGTDPLYFEQEDHARAEHDGTKFVANDNWPKPYAYYQAHEPVADQHEAVGHAVRAGYLYSGVADVARLTGSEPLNHAVHALWRNIVDKKLYITGGVGATAVGESYSYDYDLPNDLAYSETCAAVSLVFFARRMLELEPKSEYADVMELALYNTALAGMAMDGKSFFYVNPLEVRPQTFLNHDARFVHVSPLRRKWFGCACCPPNIARLVESVQTYAYTVGDDVSTLFVHLYIGGSVEAQLVDSSQGESAEPDADTHAEANASTKARPVRLKVDSAQPWDGSASVTVELGDEGADFCSFTLAFRLPVWAGGETAATDVHVAGADGETREGFKREVRDGYLYLTGAWHSGDVVSLDFSMPVRAIQANTKVSEDAGKVAFMRGPIVFCAEERDNGSQLHLVHANSAAIDEVSVEHCDFTAGSFGFGADGLGQVDKTTRPMVRLKVPGWRERPTGDDGNDAPLYHQWRPARREACTVTLIPYFAWANRGLGEMRVFLDAQ